MLLSKLTSGQTVMLIISAFQPRYTSLSAREEYRGPSMHIAVPVLKNLYLSSSADEIKT